MKTDKKIIFLTSTGSLQRRAQIQSMLRKAGISVITSVSDKLQDYSEGSLSGEFQQSQCSLHIIDSNEEGSISPEQYLSTMKFQLAEAKKAQSANPDYKIIIWQTCSFEQFVSNAIYSDLISEIQNGLTSNMVFTNVDSYIQLVEDIRNLLEAQDLKIFEVNNTDVFLIYNQSDETEANEVMDMLSDVLPLEKLNIIQNSDKDYAELCYHQLLASKMAVVYFKNSADWALPFTQQIWVKSGGASSKTPILLIGDEVPEENKKVNFKAPRVVCIVVAGELIPLEIKVCYDKILEEVNKK